MINSFVVVCLVRSLSVGTNRFFLSVGTDGFHVAALIMGLVCACILPIPYVVLHDHHGVHSANAGHSGDSSGHKIEILSEVQHHHHGAGSANAISSPMRKQQANGNVVISSLHAV